MQQISESELILMKIIWKCGGSALFSLIMEELEQEQSEWKNNTVLTLLSRLAGKNYLKTRKIGRRNEYIATVTEQEYQSAQTHDFVDRVYEGNAKNLVAALLQQDSLTDNDWNELEAFWKQTVKERTKE
ncbi:MAG: BlaI/MecI/CopY family transcriptional regulator [Eubacterium sp.]|jgi:predicted transcriptional regulator|nr:BlaI/MecI/CopY family transcriptional regulator [Eubacterium sp.]